MSNHEEFEAKVAEWPHVRAAGLPFRLLRPGHYYAPDYLTTSTNVFSDSTLYLAPFVVGNASVQVDRLALEVTGAGTAGSVYRFGIYSSAPDGAPRRLLVDAGTVDTTTVGVKEVVVDQVLPRGICWLGVAPQGAPTTNPTARRILDSLLMPRNGSNLAQGIGGWYQTGVTGALPEEYTAFLITTAGPLMFARVAA